MTIKSPMPSTSSTRVFLVDGARTPFLKATGKIGEFSGADLAVACGKTLLARQEFAPECIDETIVGCVIPGPAETNIARVISLRLGLGDKVPAWTVQRNCASGLQALDNAVCDIRLGRAQLVLAGGTEAMSHAPLLFNHQAVQWLVNLMSAKQWAARIKTLLQWKPNFLFKPVIGLQAGLTDHIVELGMGQTAEVIAHRFGITREAMDQFAVQSHLHVAAASAAGNFPEIAPLYSRTGKVYQQDTGVRADTSVEKLATLKPNFDKRVGNVTPGNSSQITDGAAMMIIASEQAVEKYHLPVLAEIIDTSWAGLNPAEMGLGPAYAIGDLLQKTGLSLAQIDAFEINEAFAAQVLACLAALNDTKFCQQEWGLSQPFGEIAIDRLNPNGGAIALGHPVGASGARIVLQLAHELKRRHATWGIASLCIGGGQGGAMLLKGC